MRVTVLITTVAMELVAKVQRIVTLAVALVSATMTQTAAPCSVKMKPGLKKRDNKTKSKRLLISPVATNQTMQEPALAMGVATSLMIATA